MIDKTLLLKGVAGVATLGGVVGGGFVLKDQIGSAISASSSGNSVGQRGNSEGTARETNSGTDNQSQEDQNTKSRAADQNVDGGGGGAIVSTTSTPESKEDSYGIPKTCTSSCDLTEEELKKIKFETLEAEGVTGDVTVENFPEEGKKISLTIDSIDTNKKKYIFSNTSDKDVKVKRGDDKTVTLKKSGKTKFTLNSKKLKERELNDYGLPKEGCDNSCTLTSTDLEDIKFKDLEEGSGDISVSSNAGKVTLEIKDVGGTNRYIFSNGSSSEISISKGSEKKVTFTSNKKSQFTADSDNKLSKLALDDYGIPTSCTSTCSLTADDLGEIKFEELNGTGTVSPTKGNVTLSVETASSEKRFTFTGSSQTITIKNSSSKSVTLAASAKTRFKGTNDNKLKKIEQNDKGLPSDCTSTCTLTVDDLKEIKFSDFEGQNGDVTVEPSNFSSSISLSISNDDYTFNNGSDQITIKKGTASVTLSGSQGTEFHIKDGKLVKGKKKSEAEIFNEKIKKAGFPCEAEGKECCKFQDDNISTGIECKLTKDQFKKLKFEKLGGEEVDENTLGGIGNDFKVKIKKIGDGEKVNYSQGSDLKFIFDGFTADLSVQKNNGGNDPIYLKANSNTEFIVNSSGKLERAWTRQRLGEKVGLTCDATKFECTVKGPINLITSSGNSNQKHEGMNKSSGSGEAKFKVTTGSGYREGYRFKVENSDITLSKEGESQKLSTGHCYEAKWDTDNKWWLAHKADTC